uniref:efflux RND transporter permease subunit n=1 Tax=Streptomyces niveiscabiei TaxID=164115 RepID=UPI0038F64870
LLKPHHGPRRGPIGYVMRGIDWTRDRYGEGVARLVRVSAISLALTAAFGAGIYAMGRVTPTGFLPEDDQGAFFVVAQLPDGASIGRTATL